MSVIQGVILFFSVAIFIQKWTNGNPSSQDHLTDDDPLPDETEGWRGLLSDHVYNYHLKKETPHILLESDIVDPGKNSNPNSPSQGHIQMFNGITDRSLRWDNATIPYEIGDIGNQFTSAQKTVIRMAIEDMARKTCLRFIQRTDQPNYLSFVSRGMGCSSYVARRDGKQLIDLAPGCTRKIGEVQHEIMHAIGFFHEQSRLDRDEHVAIIWTNVIKGLEGQFRIYGSDPQNIPYDYESIMHYGWNYFAKDSSKPTILPIRGKNVSLGTREVMSRGDVEKINRLYDCPSPTRIRTRIRILTSKSRTSISTTTKRTSRSISTSTSASPAIISRSTSPIQPCTSPAMSPTTTVLSTVTSVEMPTKPSKEDLRLKNNDVPSVSAKFKENVKSRVQTYWEKIKQTFG